MKKTRTHLLLDAEVTEGIQPYLDKIGLSLSAYVRFMLAQSYAQFTGMEKVVNFDKPVSEINIGDIVKISQVLDKAAKDEKLQFMEDEVSGAVCFD
jgi:hypothetical protein